MTSLRSYTPALYTHCGECAGFSFASRATGKGSVEHVKTWMVSWGWEYDCMRRWSIRGPIEWALDFYYAARDLSNDSSSIVDGAVIFACVGDGLMYEYINAKATINELKNNAKMRDCWVSEFSMVDFDFPDDFDISNLREGRMPNGLLPNDKRNKLGETAENRPEQRQFALY